MAASASPRCAVGSPLSNNHRRLAQRFCSQTSSPPVWVEIPTWTRSRRRQQSDRIQVRRPNARNRIEVPVVMMPARTRWQIALPQHDITQPLYVPRKAGGGGARPRCRDRTRPPNLGTRQRFRPSARAAIRPTLPVIHLHLRPSPRHGFVTAADGGVLRKVSHEGVSNANGSGAGTRERSAIRILDNRRDDEIARSTTERCSCGGPRRCGRSQGDLRCGCVEYYDHRALWTVIKRIDDRHGPRHALATSDAPPTERHVPCASASPSKGCTSDYNHGG